MILTVTLNAAVDKTYRVENYTLDRVHRPSDWRVVAGGKGINVARVYQAMGGRAAATGFLGGYNGRFIERSLVEEGIEGHFARTRGESRVCIAVVDPIASTQTEVNEIGPEVSAAEVRALRRTVKRLLAGGTFEYVTLSGSLPPGVSTGIYGEIAELAQRAGTRCVMDGSGEALREGLVARPWMVKPNFYELAYLAGRELSDPGSILEAAQGICATGIEVVAVTLGRQGCIGLSGGRAWRTEPPPIQFVSAVGSGDSFIGAFLWSLQNGGCIPDALRLGTAAGAANAEVYGAGFITKERVMALSRQVKLEACGPA